MKSKLFYTFLFAFGFFASNTSTAQSLANKWVFHGIKIEEKVRGCVNDPSTRQESVWLPRNAQYDAAYEALRVRMKAKYGDQYFTIQRIFTQAGAQKVIALVEKTWKCGAKHFTFYEGKDQAEITALAEKDKIEYKQIESYRQIYLINCAEEIAKLERQKSPANQKNPEGEISSALTKTVVERNYEGVIAKYTYIEKPDNKFTVVQLRNSKKDVEAHIVINIPGRDPIKHDLPPGYSQVDNIKSTNFSIDVYFTPYKSGDKSPGVIEWVKKKVKDSITIKDRKIITDNIAVGVRG
jgi:hypothetical protein